MPRAYNYQHNITINYKEMGAANLGRSLQQVSQGQTKTIQTTNTLNQTMAKTTKSTGDAMNAFNQYKPSVFQAGVANTQFAESTDKATAGQSKFGQSLRQNRGLLFGGTGLSSSLVEAAGMYGIYTDALTRKNEAQAEVNRLEKEGMEGTKDYSDAQQELQQQTRAFTMFQRNMALSMFDTVTFVTMLASSLLPRMGGVTAAVTTKLKALFGVMKAGQAVQMTQGISPLANVMGTLPPKVEKATGAFSKMGAVMRTIGLTNPFFIAITALGVLLAAVALNVGGLRDRFNELGQSLGDAFPALKPLLDGLGQLGQMMSGQTAQAADSVTDKYGNLSKESEELRAQTLAVDRAFANMFSTLERADVSKLIQAFNKLGETPIFDKFSKDFLGHPLSALINTFDDLTGKTKEEVKKLKDEVNATWNLYGDDIMGATMLTQEGEDAKKNFVDAFNKLMTAGTDEAFIQLFADFKAKWQEFRDKMAAESKGDTKTLTPFLLNPEEIKSNWDKAVTLSVEGQNRVNRAFETFVSKFGENITQEEFPFDIQTIVENAGLATDAEKKSFETQLQRFFDYNQQRRDQQKEQNDALMEEVEKGREDMMAIDEQMEKEDQDRRAKEAEEEQKIFEHGEEIKARVRQKYMDLKAEREKEAQEKAIEDEKKAQEESLKVFQHGEEIRAKVTEKFNEEQHKKSTETTAATYDEIIAQKDLKKEVEAMIPSIKALGQNKDAIILKAQALANKYYPMLGTTGSDVLNMIVDASSKAKDETVGLEGAVHKFFMTVDNEGQQVFQDFQKSVEAAFTNKEGDFHIKKKDIQKNLLKAWGIKKGTGLDVTVPVVTDFEFKTEGVIKGLTSMRNLIRTKASKITEGMARDFLKDWKSSLQQLGVGKDNPLMQGINKLLSDMNKGDMDSDTLKTRLAELYKQATGEDVTTDNPISKNVNEMVDQIAIDESAKEKIETPMLNAFSTVNTGADVLETGLQENMQNIMNDWATTGTFIGEAWDLVRSGLAEIDLQIVEDWITVSDTVIKAGDIVQKSINANFSSIAKTIVQTTTDVKDLGKAIKNLPSKKTIVIEIQRKLTGSGGRSGGVINSSIFTNEVREGGIIGMAEGGLINEAQIYRGVRIAEHNKPELVVPLSNPNNLADKGLNIKAPINFHLTIDGNDVLRSADIWQRIQPKMGKYQSKYGG